MDKNEIRKTYRPDLVNKPFNLLIIGEAPPAKKGNFFYFCKGALFKYTRLAFKEVFGGYIGENEDFLRFFQGQGCYVEDLCDQPTDHLGWTGSDLAKRVEIWNSEVDTLADKLKDYNPSSIFIVVKSISWYISKSIEKAKTAKAAAGQKWRLKHQKSAGFPHTKADPDGSTYVGDLSKFLSEVLKTQEPGHLKE